MENEEDILKDKEYLAGLDGSGLIGVILDRVQKTSHPPLMNEGEHWENWKIAVAKKSRAVEFAIKRLEQTANPDSIQKGDHIIVDLNNGQVHIERGETLTKGPFSIVYREFHPIKPDEVANMCASCAGFSAKLILYGSFIKTYEVI